MRTIKVRGHLCTAPQVQRQNIGPGMSDVIDTCVLFTTTAGVRGTWLWEQSSVPLGHSVWGHMASCLTPEPLRTLLGSQACQKKSTLASASSAAYTSNPHWSRALAHLDNGSSSGAAFWCPGRGCSVLLHCSVTPCLFFFFLGLCTYFCTYRVSHFCSNSFYSLLPIRIWSLFYNATVEFFLMQNS